MDFTALKAEVAAAGFARLTSAQLGVFVNRAMHELDDLEPWPYREASATGVAPLSIADLGEVDLVFDTSAGPDQPLDKRSYRELVNDFGDVGTTGGSPWFWYRATPGGVPTIATYPVSTRTVGVQYYKVVPDMVAGSDEPGASARWHGLIALIAKRMAHAEKGDRGTAESIQVEVDRWVHRMRMAELTDDAAVGVIVTGESVDG
jgi:hypothetical protein